MAARVGGRLRASAYSGRTVTLKLRRYDFTTLTRSQTLPQPDRRPAADRRHRAPAARRGRHRGRPAAARRRRLGAVGLRAGRPVRRGRRRRHRSRRPPRAPSCRPEAAPLPAEQALVARAGRAATTSSAPGWVWGRGLGRVTVRFEGPRTAPGPVRTLVADDPALHAADPPDWRAPTTEEGAAVTEPSEWTRLTQENPEHSAAYIQRFQDLAAAGHDLGRRGAAGRRDAAARVAGAGRRLRDRAGSPRTSPTPGHDGGRGGRRPGAGGRGAREAPRRPAVPGR